MESMEELINKIAAIELKIEELEKQLRHLKQEKQFLYIKLHMTKDFKMKYTTATKQLRNELKQIYLDIKAEIQHKKEQLKSIKGDTVP